MSNNDLDKILTSRKYRDVCPDTINRIWSVYAARYKKPKDIEHAVREALHGITAAFLTSDEASRVYWAIQNWHAGNRADSLLANILNKHTSTRERLPVENMDALYQRLFAATGQPDHILDLACGLNPLYLGARNIKTTGVDISGTAVSIINTFGSVYGTPVNAVCADLLCPGAIPKGRYSIALLFKILPLLERQRSGSSLSLMESIDANFIIVSFPTRTMGGHDVGMSGHYNDWMNGHFPRNAALIDRFECSDELFYVMKRI